MTAQYCLTEGGEHADVNMIGALLDCAEICQVSANFMLRGSPHHVVTCAGCAELCRACEEALRSISGDERLVHCAEICAACADSCEKMATGGSDESGEVDRGGVRVHWDRYGDGDTTVLMLPTWSIVPAQHWKFQVPYLARRHRVITIDGRGTGRSARPAGAEHYTVDVYANDALAVLDATETERAVLAALSCGTLWAVQLAADHPERAQGLVALGPAVPLAPAHPERSVHPFDDELATDEGWAKYNAPYWRRAYGDFLEFFSRRMFTEAHSTKQCEDLVAWGSDIDPATLIDTHVALDACGR